MQSLFNLVYHLLLGISKATGLTYNEINIIVFYFVIPMIYFAMIDEILKKHTCKSLLIILSISILFFTDFRKFSDWLFSESVGFLLSFQAIGWNYIVASVIICVFVPAALFVVLFYYSYWPSLKKLSVKQK